MSDTAVRERSRSPRRKVDQVPVAHDAKDAAEEVEHEIDDIFGDDDDDDDDKSKNQTTSDTAKPNGHAANGDGSAHRNGVSAHGANGGANGANAAEDGAQADDGVAEEPADVIEAVAGELLHKTGDESYKVVERDEKGLPVWHMDEENKLYYFIVADLKDDSKKMRVEPEKQGPDSKHQTAHLYDTKEGRTIAVDAPAIVDLDRKLPIEELTAEDKVNYDERLTEVKLEIKEWLKAFVLDGDKQNMLFAHRNASLKKRFQIDIPNEVPPRIFPNCPAYIRQEIEGYFGGQPAASEFRLDFDSGSSKSFVVDIPASAFGAYLEKSGLTAISNFHRTDASVAYWCRSLNQINYDSGNGLLHWRKATSILRLAEGYEFDIDAEKVVAIFKKHRIDKAVARYRKHDDGEVVRLATAIIKKFRQIANNAKEEADLF